MRNSNYRRVLIDLFKNFKQNLILCVQNCRNYFFIKLKNYNVIIGLLNILEEYKITKLN